MSKVIVLQQVLDPSGIGGVSAEFRALHNSKLSEKYDFRLMILCDIRPGISYSNIKFYYQRIKSIKPDIVHIRGAAVDGLNAIIAAKLAGHCKILTTVHGMYSDMIFYNPIKRWICKNIVENLIFSLSNGISCVCRSAMQRHYFDKYRNKMLPYVYNRMPSYDLKNKSHLRQSIRDEYDIAENDVVCLFVGRMTREKGLQTIERIFENHLVTSERLVFLFVGDGDYRRTFEINCRKYEYRIIFAGLRSDVQPYYMASDFFLQPSLHENHSIALLEACAAGIPSIATNCGGNAEIISNKYNGLIVPVDDSASMANAINYMSERSILNLYTQNVLSSDFSRFSDDECDKALDSVYQLILQKK